MYLMRTDIKLKRSQLNRFMYDLNSSLLCWGCCMHCCRLAACRLVCFHSQPPMQKCTLNTCTTVAANTRSAWQQHASEGGETGSTLHGKERVLWACSV
jgi:hypothetical protein